MALAIFSLILTVYLAIASSVLYRSPSHGWGFPMFVLVYPIFLVGWFFLSTNEAAVAWLVPAVANMLVQGMSIRRQKFRINPTATLIASLFLWPIQFAATLHNLSSDKIADLEKAAGRARIGALPGTASGTVSYTHHIDIDTGYELVWLKEYGELEFFIESSRFDALRIAEDRRFTFTVDEREAPKDLSDGKLLWILDGQSG
ncbi:MAG: hypothetical protein AAGA33_13775 [Pseudomonadota bacterium]